MIRTSLSSLFHFFFFRRTNQPSSFSESLSVFLSISDSAWRHQSVSEKILRPITPLPLPVRFCFPPPSPFLLSPRTTAMTKRLASPSSSRLPTRSQTLRSSRLAFFSLVFARCGRRCRRSQRSDGWAAFVTRCLPAGAAPLGRRPSGA